MTTLPYVISDPYIEADLLALATQPVAYTQYGVFYDTTTQTLANTTTAYPVAIGSTDGHNGVTITSGNRITFVVAGVYGVQVEVQLANNGGTIADATIWFRLNGTDVPYSSIVRSVNTSHVGVDGHTTASMNRIFSANAGDYLQLYWHADSTAISITSIAAGALPTLPAAPSVVVSVYTAAQLPS